MPADNDNVIAFTPRPAGRRKKTRRPALDEIPAGAELEPLIDSWHLALESATKSPHTIRTYLRSARYFVAFLTEQGMPTDAERIHAEHVRAFLVAERKRASASTAKSHHANLGSFFSWLISEEERTSVSPVLKADRPTVHANATRYLTDDEFRALLEVCKGPDFWARRDTALFRLFNDCGARVGGLAEAQLKDLDLRNKTLFIRLKGGDEWIVPFGARTAQALDRYLRVRKTHPRADTPWVWLGHRGRTGAHLTDDGVRAMMRRRGKQAGIVDLHPHRFRARFAHEHLAAGGSARGAMAVAGWKSEAMLHHYSAELAAERAREEHARLGVGDRF